MKKHTALTSVLMFLTFSITMAQYLPNSSYFMYDFTRTNPGSLGSKDMLCANGIWKQSLTQFDGSPDNFVGSLSIPFKLLGAKHGTGISIVSDSWGFYSDVEFKVGYAFRFNVADGTLGIGVNGIFRQKKLAPEWDVGPEGDPSDMYIPEGKQDENGFGIDAGVFYRSEDTYIGASVSNAYFSGIDYYSTGLAGSAAYETIKPHYYVTAGHIFQLSNPAFEIEPAVHIFSDGRVHTFDFNGRLTYNKKIWGGLSYRAGSAVVGMAGLMIFDGLNVGLAYDFNTAPLSQITSGYEVLLNYCFKLGVEKSPQKYRSIRYL